MDASQARPQNQSQQRHICVFGAGAVGSVLAARLARAGRNVSIVARPAHVAAVNARGLALVEHGELTVVQVHAAEDARDLPRPDLTVVTLKAYSLPAAAESIGRLADGGPVVFVVNGVPWWYFQGIDDDAAGWLPRLDPDGALRRALAPEQVMGGVARQPCELPEPGVARSNSVDDSLLIGEPAGGLTSRLQQVASWLEGSSKAVIASADIRAVIWDKLLVNLPSSLLTTLTLSPSSEVVANPATADLYRRIVEEGRAVAAAHGIHSKTDVEAQMARAARTRHRPSMLQDLLRGKPLELDAQLLAVRDLARRASVPTPLVDTLIDLLVQRAAAH